MEVGAIFTIGWGYDSIPLPGQGECGEGWPGSRPDKAHHLRSQIRQTCWVPCQTAINQMSKATGGDYYTGTTGRNTDWGGPSTGFSEPFLLLHNLIHSGQILGFPPQTLWGRSGLGAPEKWPIPLRKWMCTLGSLFPLEELWVQERLFDVVPAWGRDKVFTCCCSSYPSIGVCLRLCGVRGNFRLILMF